MIMDKYLDYILEQMKTLLAIDSPSGYTQKVTDYLMAEYQRLGYHPLKTVKGGVLTDLESGDAGQGVLLEAHVDTLGAMVSEIKGNGRLKVTPIGGMNANNAEGENCRIVTRFGGIYEGTCQLINASVHVNGDYDKTGRTFDTVEIVPDEPAADKEAVAALGISPGDYVCFAPRTVITRSGYIKSRFLDDKLSAAILLGYAKYVREEGISLKKRVYQHMTVFEEVGHGGASSIPDGVKDVMSVDLGCVGEGLCCTEQQVSICAKDSRGPYHYDLVTSLVKTARDMGLAYAVDVYPHYGSDADVALTAGYDVRHGLIGPGVYASHGYERSHVEGVKNTFLLIKGLLG